MVILEKNLDLKDFEKKGYWLINYIGVVFFLRDGNAIARANAVSIMKVETV
jgi:hypothetical protein